MPDPPRWPKYTWDAVSRQYRDEGGRFVARTAVRQALDETIDAAGQSLTDDARALQAGKISLVDWQLRGERSIKAIHTASVAAAAGGWAQATPADWAEAGRRIRFEYGKLDEFAREIANGLPLDGRFVTRAGMYAGAGSRTYERAQRRLDLATGLVVAERRLLHSNHPCTSCYGYEGEGWQEPGVLPDIGEACECTWRCRCSFERKMIRPDQLKFAQTERALDNGWRTVWIDVDKFDAAWQQDTGYAIGPEGQGAIGGRIPGVRKFLVKAQQEGMRVEQPRVTVDEAGGVSFVDGRHRFAVLRDLGLDRVPVSVAPDEVATMRRLYGAPR